MNIITDTQGWASAICDLPEGKPYVSTYNVAAFMSNGPAHRVLKFLNNRSAMLVVGVPAFRSCLPHWTSKCKHCLKKHTKSLQRLAYLRGFYNQIEWKFVKENHTKCVVCDRTCLLGGRNLSDSRYNDLTFMFDDSEVANQLRDMCIAIASDEYDIGTDGPLVFLGPYKGEIMADSTSIPDIFKQAVIEDHPQSDLAGYWK